jgi:ABC-type uncharacterized transport system ATPase subunit
MNRPQILFLDEPTAGLSETELGATERLFRQVTSLSAVVLVEHNLDFVAQLSTRTVFMSGGRVLADGPFAEVRQNVMVQELYSSAQAGDPIC